jgi:hypothetical protein
VTGWLECGPLYLVTFNPWEGSIGRIYDIVENIAARGVRIMTRRRWMLGNGCESWGSRGTMTKFMARKRGPRLRYLRL